MVLVDTSVWIRFLANRLPYAQEMDRLLTLEEVTGHELVYGELLLGGRDRRKILAAYELLHRADAIPHRDVVEFVRTRNLHNRGVGWVEIHLLASALVARVSLWTADSSLSNVAAELGVAYGRFA